MQTVILDTDIAIDFLRGKAYAKELMVSLWERDTAHFSILSIFELYAGMRKKEEEKTDNFINACKVELIIPAIAKRAGELKRNYKSKGITLPSIDCLIAATAIVHNHKIATRNISHYPDKKILYKIDAFQKH